MVIILNRKKEGRPSTYTKFDVLALQNGSVFEKQASWTTDQALLHGGQMGMLIIRRR